MDLQYISDTDGKHTAVIIPIEQWNNITTKYQDLKILENPKGNIQKKKPSDFRGAISKQTAIELIQYTEQARAEWETRIS